MFDQKCYGLLENFSVGVKGIVHQKIKILLFTQPQVVPNLSFFLLLNTKEDILKNVSDQTVDSNHWLPHYEKIYI